jgi:protein O-mannosyl-transferase
MPDTRPHTDKPTGSHLAAALILILAVGATFWQLPGNGFINFDDPRYVTENVHVRAGLTPENFIWAFTTTEASNWHPLTWLSHMIDIELFGMNPAGHHLISLLFHAITAIILYLALFRMTGSRMKSLAVALLFAVHPLHVESVAWAAERKDVLSGLFFMLTLYLYAVYVEHPSPPRYLATLVLFSLGLMAKPMLVTLPFLLLLLDAWPLDRAARNTAGPGTSGRIKIRITEKLPFFLLSAMSGVITFLVQKKGGAVAPLEFVPLADRIANALHAYGAYLGKMIWPSNLAVFYPFSRLDSLQIFGSVLALTTITVLAAIARKRHPYLLVGWLWYLGMMVPVIGLVQVGNQAMADRYTYLPLIGPFVMIVWGGSDFGKWIGLGPKGRAAITAAVLMVLVGVGRIQVGYWQNSIRLFTHTLAATDRNAVAHSALGSAYGDAGNTDAAVVHFRKALEIVPGNPFYHFGLGLALEESGDPAGAAGHLQKALEIDTGPTHRQKVLVALGSVMERLGKPDKAAALFREAIDIDSRNARAHAALGNLLARQHKTAEAIAHYAEAAVIDPGSAAIHNGLARLLLKAGDTDGALYHYREAVRLDPDSSEGHFVLGRYALERNDPSSAIRHFRKGLRNSPDNGRAYFYLGIALARENDLPGAAESFFEAVHLDPEFAEAYNNLGMVLGKLGREDSAAAAFENALRIRPGYRLAREHLEKLRSRKE